MATAQGALVNDIACLTGNGECTSGETHSMTLVEVSDADFAHARDVLVNQVLPNGPNALAPIGPNAGTTPSALPSA